VGTAAASKAGPVAADASKGHETAMPSATSTRAQAKAAPTASASTQEKAGTKLVLPSNQALLRLGAIRAKRMLGAVPDPAERDADLGSEAALRRPADARIPPTRLTEIGPAMMQRSRAPGSADSDREDEDNVRPTSSLQRSAAGRAIPVSTTEIATQFDVARGPVQISQASDPAEIEADQIADKVMRMPDSAEIRGSRFEHTNGDEGVEIQRKRLPLSSGIASESPEHVLGAIRSGGAPLDRGTRDFFEPRLGHDLSGVRIHTGETASDSARRINARAYALGGNVVFSAGEYKPHSESGRRLLAHELVHVVQQTAGHSVGLQAQPRSGTHVLPDLTGLVRAARDTDQALVELIQLAETTGLETPQRRDLLTDLRQRQTEQRAYVDTLEFITQNPTATSDPEQMVSHLWLPSTSGSLVSQDLDAFFGAGQPLSRQIQLRTNYHQRLLTVLQLVHPRVRDLADMLTAVGSDPPDFVRETFHIVIGHYVRLMRLPLETALVRLAFLNRYYENTNTINWYALSRHIRQNLEPFYASLRITAESYALSPDLADLRGSQGGSRAATPRESAELRAIETIRNLDIITTTVGEPPAAPAEVTATYLPSNPQQVVEMFLDLHALIAVLALWKPLDALSHMLTQAIYAGTPIAVFDEDARARWESELTDLRGAFMDETRRRDHPNLEANIEPWRARLQVLIDEIPPSVRRRQIAAAIATEIPFLFVGGATVLRVGLWVSRITRGSRLLIALAEGATMTVLNFAATPAGAPGRPSSAAGWVGQFAVNTALAFFGRLLFQGAGLAADRLTQGRGLLVQLGARVAVPITGITALQTAAQAVQDRVRRQGGETNYTEMFTLNLLLNSIGILLGAATLAPGPATGGTALAPRPGSAAPVRLTPAELAQQAGIPEDVARQLLEIGARLDAYNQSVATVQEAARRGTLTEPEFEAMRQQAHELIDFLESRLPAIADQMGGRNVSASSIRASLDAARARISGMSYSARPTVVALLPEATEGLTRVGQSDTWVYPREQPPSRLPALRSDYERRGHTVRELPGGGWEALPTATSLGARILPVSAMALGSIAPSIETLAAVPQAQAGLAQIRAQAHVTPELLEADLAAAAASTPARRAATDVLRQLRLLDPDRIDSWRGLENYLRLGGDLPTLRRMLVLYDRAQMPADQQTQVVRVLAAMSTWNAETLRGLQAVYRLRPRTTTAEIGRLLMDHPPAMSEGVLESIATLEPNSRGLSRVIGAFLTETTAGSMALNPQQIGAIGALHTGMELRAEFPGQILSFEEPQFGATGEVERIIDINVYERQSRRVAGREQVTEHLTVSVEVKEVTRQSLGRRAPHQLALDIVRDHRIRAGRVTPVGAARPYFETLRWRIRRAEFEQEAMQRVGATVPEDPRVEPEMRRMVQRLLEPAFDDLVLERLPAGEADNYRRAFDGVRFVQFR
jgi:hypothetical protein